MSSESSVDMPSSGIAKEPSDALCTQLLLTLHLDARSSRLLAEIFHNSLAVTLEIFNPSKTVDILTKCDEGELCC